MAIIDGKMSEDLTSDSTLPQTEAGMVSLEESKSETGVADENLSLSPLVSYIKGQYNRSKDQRRFDEQRWLMAYNNYRGLYSADVQFMETEKSRAFIKITKTKVLAAYAQIMAILFSGSKFPLGVESSKIPVGIEKEVHFDPKDPDNQGFKQNTVVRDSILKSLGPLAEKLSIVQDKLKPGVGTTSSAYTFEPAKEAARNMEMLMHDQLDEGNASKELDRLVFEMALFGTGVFKGPFAVDKEYPRWTEDGEYEPELQTIPGFSHVSIWDAYPDPDARNMSEAELFIQRHRLSKTQLRALKNRPNFREQSIEIAIRAGPNYTREYWEDDLHDGDILPDSQRYEVLEYWGILDKEIAEQLDFPIPDKLKKKDQFQINAWVCNDQILRIVLNPFTPSRIPYYACPYELNPYSFFGVGVAENMEDTQLIMNGFIRLAVDNATLSSNVILDVDESALADGQDFKLFPGKIFRRNGGNPGMAINAINVPNVTQQALMMFDKARQLSDEATGMPSYSHGVSGIMGVGRTASGMSMLMGAAKENIKAVIRNIDEYLLIPFGKSMFAFNMQFNFDPKYLGDLEIVAKGTESLMRNEIRSQKLLQFLQITGNPMDAPYVKRDYILRELAISLDLESDKVVNDPREAALQAEMIKKMSEAMGIPPMQPGQGGNPASAPGVQDPTGNGGGNIAPGAAPGPDEQGFSGGGGGSPQAAQAQMSTDNG